MTHVQYGIAVISVTAVLAMGGCQGSGGAGPLAQSPGDVVKAAWMTANAGQYSQADKYLSSEVLDAMKSGLGALAGGTKGVWDGRTRNGTISEVEILKEEARGEGAKVYFRVHFKDGKTKDDDEAFIKQNGEWKIALH